MTEPTGKKVSENPEVVEKAARRRFTAEYKQRIVMEAGQFSNENGSGHQFLGVILSGEIGTTIDQFIKTN